MKTKYKILTGILIFAFVLGLNSCSEDFLQTVPTDSVSTEIALGSTDNMILAINGIHRSIYAQNPGIVRYYAGQQYMIPMAEYAAGDALHSTTGNNWFREVLQWVSFTDATSNDVTYPWWFYYNVIGSANNIINAAMDLQMSDDLHNVLGQAYTYRAWAHFNLVRFFAKPYMVGNPSSDPGVPIMLATEPPYNGLARNSVQEVYDQIKADLNEAITHFADASGRADLSHINIDVAKGIAARVYLTIGDWENAAKYANEARQGYSLMDEAEYKSGFNNWDNPEWMWGSKIIQDQTAYYWAYFYYCSNNFNGTQNRSNPKFMNHKLYDMMSDTDYRKDLILKDCPSTFDEWDKGENAGRYANEDEYEAAIDQYREIVNNSEEHNMVPYMHIKLSQADGSSITPMDMIHMRAAEMYLIEAEALARQNKNNEAQDILYALVSERDSGYGKSTNTGQALVDEILLQRRIELFLEGHRWFDMLRNDEALDLEGSGADPDLYLGGFKQAKPSVNSKWTFLIPQRELDANPNMVQNE
ncbi:MAG: RagB/SusD family nutrient uptake outer membrane protein [Draconibacterium sp.]|nr:MAG: RagB/SusD family nutrient uptake outer membrane protein [Draconibacterium sp.]